jgi:hypothetical protein
MALKQSFARRYAPWLVSREGLLEVGGHDTDLGVRSVVRMCWMMAMGRRQDKSSQFARWGGRCFSRPYGPFRNVR